MAAGEGAGAGSPGRWWTGDLDGQGLGRTAGLGEGDSPSDSLHRLPCSPPPPQGGPSREGLSAFSSSGHIKKSKTQKPVRGAGQLG